MKSIKITRALAMLAGLAALGTAAHAAPQKALPAATAAKVSAAAPVVKIGDALLEEYHNSDPEHRTTLVRRGETAKSEKPSGGDRRHS